MRSDYLKVILGRKTSREKHARVAQLHAKGNVRIVGYENTDGARTFSIGFESVGGEEGNEFRYSDVIARHFATNQPCYVPVIESRSPTS